MFDFQEAKECKIKALISNRGLNYVLTYLRFAKFPIKRRHHLPDNDEWLVTIC